MFIIKEFENYYFFFIAKTLVPSPLEKGRKSIAWKCYLIYFWRIFFFLNFLIFCTSMIAALKVVWPGPDQNCRHQQGIVGPKGAGDGAPGNNGRRQVSDRYCTIPFNIFKYFAYFQLLSLEIKPWQQRMIIFFVETGLGMHKCGFVIFQKESSSFCCLRCSCYNWMPKFDTVWKQPTIYWSQASDTELVFFKWEEFFFYKRENLLWNFFFGLATKKNI